MQRVEGNQNVALLECVNPVKQNWRVRWDVTPTTDGLATYMEAELNHRPTTDEVKSLVIGWINEQITAEILGGFRYDGALVWLSAENQFNYKAAYDLAIQTGGATLPVKFKFGDDETPVYREFKTIEELSLFYFSAMQHVQKTLAEGWAKKDVFDVSGYE
jgi:hypothetical protein